jgi:hypothetical protein
MAQRHINHGVSTCFNTEAPVRFSSYERPEESPMERHLALLVFLASFLYLYLFQRYTAMDPDEGIILQGAERILRGKSSQYWCRRNG